MFTVDCQCHNVDIVFTENETNSRRRRRVLHKRQLKNIKPCDSDIVCAEMTDTGHPVPTQPANTGPSTSSATLTMRDASSTHSVAELSRLLSADEVVVADIDTDLFDTDSSSDELSDSSSQSQGSALTALYTKDAFHKYIIAGTSFSLDF